MSATVAIAPEEAGAPAQPRGYATGWWGMVVLIMTEATVFAALLSSYFFIRATSKTWPQGGIDAPELGRILVFTFVLLGSSVPLFWAEAAIRRDELAKVRVALILSFVMGTAFLGNQLLEYLHLPFGIHENAYASLFWTITGLHGFHVLVGLVMSAVVQMKAWMGKLSHERHLTLSVFSLYWHFVDVVWIFVFSSLYLSPHLR